MISTKVACALAAFAAAIISADASAQSISTQKQLKPEIARDLNIDPTRLRPDFKAGSTVWISPMLLNAPGTISGEQYTVNGKVSKTSFGLSVINPGSQGAANAAVSCFTSAGVQLPRYNSAIAIAKLGASNWLSSSVTPPPTTDGAHEDKDEVWCAVTADRPVVVFGWTERRFGADIERANFSLERGEP